MIQLVVSDLDGTLLNDEHQLPTDFWKVEQQLFDKNILLAIASGRQLYNIVEFFDKIKDRTIFLAENGTYALYNGKELFVNSLEFEAAIQLVKIGRNIPNSCVIVCGKNSAYIENKEEQFLSEIQNYYSKITIVDDLTLVEDEILKITICDFENVATNSYLYFKNLENNFKIAISGKIWLDITAKNANKGVAVKYIQEYFNISKDTTMVFGDFLNDLEMMQTAKYSFAMKNAHQEIIKIANFVTDYDNNNDGVTKILKPFLENKKPQNQ